MDRVTLSIVEDDAAVAALTEVTGLQFTSGKMPVLVARRAHNAASVGAVRLDVRRSNNGILFAHVGRVCVSGRLRASHQLSVRGEMFDHVHRVLADHFEEMVVVTMHPRRLVGGSMAGWRQPAGANLLQRTAYPSGGKIAAMWGEVI